VPQQIGPITDSATGTKITCATIDGSTPVTNGDGLTCSHGFALHDPSYFTVGATEQFCAVVGKSTGGDSVPTCNSYTITGATTITDAFGMQCQSNAVNCPSYGIPSTFPPHLRVWDCASPYYSVSTGGTNCTWASIEATAQGTYTWTALDNWMIAIANYRTTHPNFVASYTFGEIPCVWVNFPGPFTITGVTGTTGSGTSGTITFSGSFGSTSLLGMYVSTSGLIDPANNIAVSGTTGTGQVLITAWTSSSVTVTGAAGTIDTTSQSGTMTIVPGAKGCGILPRDLATWNGTPPMPTISSGTCAGQYGSCAFNTFVTALVNHCTSAQPTVCFYNTFNIVEGWNEPNNSFFCNPGYCNIPQIVQMLEGAIPIIRAKMTGSGGTNQVIVQSVATTAAAAASGLVLATESANGVLSDYFAWHQYFSTAPNVAPETIVGNMKTIANQRSSNVGFANTPARITETSWQSNSTPYGCSQGSPWTQADCIGQMVRWQLLADSNGIGGLDWYNGDGNILKVSAYQGAYYWQQQYLNGGHFTAVCSNSGQTYTCPFVESNGTTALWVYLYCPNNGSYATCAANGTSYTVPAGYVDYRLLNGGLIVVANPGQSITIGVQPFMLEQAGAPTNLVIAPALWMD
jgi:hypothetical protein